MSISYSASAVTIHCMAMRTLTESQVGQATTELLVVMAATIALSIGSAGVVPCIYGLIPSLFRGQTRFHRFLLRRLHRLIGNLLYLLGYAGPGQLRIFGRSNEKYVVREGCDQIPARLAAALAADQIRTGWQLTKLTQSADAVTLTFKVGTKTQTVTADRVVLATNVFR